MTRRASRIANRELPTLFILPVLHRCSLSAITRASRSTAKAPCPDCFVAQRPWTGGFQQLSVNGKRQETGRPILELGGHIKGEKALMRRNRDAAPWRCSKNKSYLVVSPGKHTIYYLSSLLDTIFTCSSPQSILPLPEGISDGLGRMSTHPAYPAKKRWFWCSVSLLAWPGLYFALCVAASLETSPLLLD